MVASFAFANKGILTIDGTEVGVVKDVEVTFGAEHVPLYGWKSILRQAVAKHTAKVAVKVGYMKIDPVKTTGWQFKILNPTAPDGSVLDTNTVKLFAVIADFVFESGVTLRATITDVYFPSFPMKAAEGQWIKVDMTGEGSTIVYSNA